MSDERVMILRMLKEGKLTIEEAEALLEALEEEGLAVSERREVREDAVIPPVEPAPAEAPSAAKSPADASRPGTSAADGEPERPGRADWPAGAAFGSLGEEIRNAVNEALKGMR